MQNSSKTFFWIVCWAIYIVLALSYMLVLFQRVVPAVMANELMQAFHTTGTALGFLAAMYFYIYTVMQLPSGILADTLGTRWTVVISNAVAGVGSLIFGLAPSFEIAMLGRFLVGLGVSGIFIAFMKSNSLWFPARYYATISGLSLFVGNLGSIVAGVPLSYALNWFSWRWVFILIGGLSLILAVVTAIFVRNRPEEVGFEAVNANTVQNTASVSTQQLIADWMLNLREVFAIKALWTGFLVYIGSMGSFFAFVGLWAMPFLTQLHGLSRQEASTYVTLTLFSFALIALIAGGISDYLKSRRPLVVLGALCYCVIWAILMWHPLISGIALYVLFALIGACAGCFVITFTMAKELVKPALAGTAIGLVNMGLFLGTSILQPLFGTVLDQFWDGVLLNNVRIYSVTAYQAGMGLMLIFALIAFYSALKLPETFKSQ